MLAEPVTEWRSCQDRWYVGNCITVYFFNCYVNICSVQSFCVLVSWEKCPQHPCFSVIATPQISRFGGGGCSSAQFLALKSGCCFSKVPADSAHPCFLAVPTRAFTKRMGPLQFFMVYGREWARPPLSCTMCMLISFCWFQLRTALYKGLLQGSVHSLSWIRGPLIRDS
jgi:hypothetical protein